MSAGDQIEKLWPSVTWTGSSNIHRSLMLEKQFKVDYEKTGELITLLSHGQYPEQLYGLFQDTFMGAEFLLSPDEFRSLCLLDYYRHMTGKGDSHTEKKLTNPMTGSKFHRMALINDFVGGVRFWANPSYYNSGTILGLRFRWEGKTEDEEITRIKVREKVEVDSAEWEEVKAAINIPEPTEEEAEKARERVRIEDNDDSDY